MIELKNICKEYSRGGGAEPLTVLKNLNLQIQAGESLAVAGPSGCGKSTLLHIIGALDTPTEGTVILYNQDLGKLKRSELARIRNQQIGFIFQLHYLLPQCTVLENILVPTLADDEGRGQAEVEQKARQLLEAVGLADFADYRPGQLSGGQRQRVAVARALINDPQILLADEPTGSLDEHTAESIGELLVNLNRDHKITLLIVTHSSALARKMNRVLKLENGQLRNTSN